MPAEFAVQPVVGGHHGGDTLVDAALEVGEVEFAEDPLAHPHIHPEPAVLDAVGGEVLDAGHDMPLHPPDESGAHLAQEHRILAESFLGSAPCGMPEEIDAHAGEKVRPLGARLYPDGVADPLFQLRVPGSAPRDGDGETGR